MENINKFNEIVAKTFAELYSKFPEPKDIICEEESKEGKIFWTSTMGWLETYGYIKGNLGIPHCFTHARLTEKGLICMNKVPKSLDTKNSIGKELIDGSGEISKGAISALIAEIFLIGARF